MQGHKILLVEDETYVDDLLKNHFKNTAERIEVAHTGAEALEKLTEKPDIVLLDISMPQLDGYGVYRRIRELLSCPVLLLTARVATGERGKGFDADSILVKPFDLDELGARVESYLNRGDHRRSMALTA